jgi:hypothetical protein
MDIIPFINQSINPKSESSSERKVKSGGGGSIIRLYCVDSSRSMMPPRISTIILWNVKNSRRKQQ